MNKLLDVKRIQILQMHVEGSSMRSISRVVGVSINTITKLLTEAGEALGEYHHRTVRGLKCKRIQCDEVWSFCYAKEKNVASAKRAPADSGDVWTWTSICADSKLICNWVVGDRGAECAAAFMGDLASRLSSRPQLTTDGLGVYVEAVEGAFGAGVDFAQLVKTYRATAESMKGKYSPAECTGCRKIRVEGNPDMKHVSTSYVERNNLSIRMGMRRFTRLTNGFSKKIDNHCHALAIYFSYFNFVRIHKAHKTSPAMAAGLTNNLWEMSDLLKIVDEYQETKKAA